MENRSLSNQEKQNNEELQEEDVELNSKQLQEKKEKERDRIIAQSQNVGELVGFINKLTEENDKMLDENKKMAEKREFILDNGYAHHDNINEDLTSKTARQAHIEHLIKGIKEQFEQQQLEDDGRKLAFEQVYLQRLIQTREVDKNNNRALNEYTGKEYKKEADKKGMNENWLKTVLEWQEFTTQQTLREQQKQEGETKQQIDAKGKKLKNKMDGIQKQKKDEQEHLDTTKQRLADKIKANTEKAEENEQKKEQIMQRIRELRAAQKQAQQKGDNTKDKMLDNDISQAERQKQDVEHEQQNNKLNISGVGKSNNVYQPTNSMASLQQQNGLGM